jgi:hypothetical protein
MTPAPRAGTWSPAPLRWTTRDLGGRILSAAATTLSVMTVMYSARARGDVQRPVPHPDVVARARAAVRGPYLAILLYGSQARGSQRPDSDIDVLQVVQARPGKYSDGNVNVTAYTIDTLWEMCQQGSLFMLHLCMDGYMIEDPERLLSEVLDSYERPNHFANAIAELTAAARALTVDDAADHWDGLRKLGIYVARTACYAVLADRGEPEFDPELVAERLKVPAMQRALRLRHEAPCVDDLHTLYSAVVDLLGDVPPAGTTLDSLAVELLYKTPYAATLMIQALAGGTDGFEYTALGAPPI